MRLGRYGEQLEHLYRLFPREQVLVFRYRDLVDRPAETLDRICPFLGVTPGLVTEIPRENVTAHPEPTLGHRLLSAAQRVSARVPGRIGAAAVRRAASSACSGGPAPASRSPGTQRQALIGYFADDIRLLQEVTGADFSDWLRPRERSGGLVGARPAGQRQARNGRPRPSAEAG